MASLTELRVKIQGVRSIQQITKAMKMIAGVRLTRAQKQMQEAQTFSARVGSMVGQMLNAQQEALNRRLSGRALSGDVIHPLVRERDSHRVGMIIVGGDKGLCGGYNTSVVHHGLKSIQGNRGKEVYLFTIGRKVQERLARTEFTGSVRVQRVKEYGNVMGNLSFVQSEKIADDIRAQYQALQLSRVVAVFSEAKSLIKHEVQERQLLPIVKPAEERLFDGILEPDREALLGTLIPFYLKTQLYALLRSACFSELAARMTAMDNASRNAQELIDGLTLELNKVRQSTITRELAEIVGASEAIAHR